MKSTNLHKQKSSMPGAKSLLAIVVAFCFGHTQGFAQMKVGNNPTVIDASSMFEVEATNQGILLPRISIGNIATWGLAGATPIDGMFVYNKNAATTGGSGLGIYYWTNSKWNYVQNGATAITAWQLTGNSTTTPGTYAVPGTNFIGTIDGVDFAVRTTNAERMRISAAGQIGINQNFLASQQLAVTTAVAASTAVVGQNTTAAGVSTGIGVLGTTLQSLGYGVNGTNGNAAGVAIYGQNTVASGAGTGTGVLGTTIQSLGYGVRGTNSNAAGTGIWGESSAVSGASTGIGVLGTSIQSLGYGVKGTNGNAAGIAILGQNTVASGTGGNGIGVEGLSAQAYNAVGPTNGYGMVALNSNASGTGFYAAGNNLGLNSNFLLSGSGATMVGLNVGGFAYSIADNGIGLYGYNVGASGIGVYGYNNNTTAHQQGVYGTYNTAGFGAGVTGIGYLGTALLSTDVDDIGIYGSANDYGVYGFNGTNSLGVLGNTNGTGIGVYGQNTGTGIGVYGYSVSTGVGVYGTNNNATSTGVWGTNTNSLGTGVMGAGNNATATYFVQGQGGAFTGTSIGASGYIPIASSGGLIGTDYSTGSYAFFGRADYYRTSSNNNAVYQFGVYGEKVMGYNGAGTIGWDKRAGGVLGSVYDISNTRLPVWGSLGYKSSGTTANTHYGVYATTTLGGTTGFAEDKSIGGYGMGINGGIMGGWVRGDVYGMNIKGKRYGLYIDGYTYSNKPSVQLIDNGGGERTVAYNVSSLSADVYAHGKGKMVNGKAQITFDRGFTQIVDESDLAVTVTPIGESNGVHLVVSTGTGFSLQENKNADNSFGSSDAEFTWIAVGKRKDVKPADIAKEVLSKDYDKNMDGVMFNDNDKTHDAGGMEWTKDGLKFYPVTNAETSVVENKSAQLKTAQAVPPKNDAFTNGVDPSKKKTVDPKKKNAVQQPNKLLADKKSEDKKSDPPPAPKKD